MVRPSSAARVLVLFTALLGCKALKPSPEKKACEQIAKFQKEDGREAEPTSVCLERLEEIKQKNPIAHACTLDCMTSHETKEEALKCTFECEYNQKQASKTHAVDDLTPTKIQAIITEEYEDFGYDISNEQTNDAGWVGTVRLGKEGTYGEVHIYKVALLNINGRQDGNQAVAKLDQRKGPTETRIGEKKALYVECLHHRVSNETGTPKACRGHNSRIQRFTNELAAR